MSPKNQIIRRGTVLLAALATLLTGGALPAAGSEPAPPDPATSHPPSSPEDAATPGNAASPGSAPPSGTPASPSGKTAPSQSAAQPQSAPASGSAAPSGDTQPSQHAAPPSGAPSQGDAPSPSDAPSQSASPSVPPSPSAPPSDAPDPRSPQALLDPAAPDAPADPAAPGAAGVPGGQPSLINTDPRGFGARIFRGYAFDTCQAPSLATMRAWKKSSPYGAAGVYIGGRGRACPNQKHLSASWVKSVSAMGWKLLPLYVGSQAPCVGASHKRKHTIPSSAPYQQGRKEGLDAVRQARKLGMARRSAVYLDMESYNYKNTRCANTTLRFIQGWNSAVRAQGYIAGFYSSSDSGIAHLERARAAGARGLPTAMWFARWRVPKSVDSERRLHRAAWQPHRRIHQFTGNVTRKYGGHKVNIDQNLVDAPVAVTG